MPAMEMRRVWFLHFAHTNDLPTPSCKEITSGEPQLVHPRKASRAMRSR